MDYDWGFLYELGYTKQEMIEYQKYWSKEILADIASEKDNNNFVKNISEMMAVYNNDKKFVFRMIAMFKNTFLMDSLVFKERLSSIHKALREGSCEAIFKVLIENENIPIQEKMATLTDDQWKEIINQML